MSTELLTDRINGFAHVWQPGKDSETLLLLHGTGGDEHDLLGIGRALAPNASLLSPRGKVLEGGRYNRFFRRLAQGVFDIEDLKARTDELAEFVAAAAVHYGFDSSRLTAAGFSNGANIGASLLLLRPEVIRRAVLLSPMTPLVPDLPPDLSGKTVFIGAGRADPIAPPSEVNRLSSLLRECGASVTEYFHTGGHSISQDEFDAAREWL